MALFLYAFIHNIKGSYDPFLISSYNVQYSVL